MTTSTDTCTHPEEACMYNPYTGDLTCFECMAVLDQDRFVPEDLRKEWANDYASKLMNKEKPVGLASYLAQQLIQARAQLGIDEELSPDGTPNIEDARIIEFHMQNGETNMAIKYPGVAVIASQIGRYFVQEGGKNYAQARMFDSETGKTYVLTVQPDHKPMPSEIVSSYRHALTMILNHSRDPFAKTQAEDALKEFGHLTE